MALSLAAAATIVVAIANDLRSKAVLSGPNTTFLQNEGLSGPVRNLVNATGWTFSGWPFIPEVNQDDVQRVSCIGISMTTTMVVNDNSVALSNAKGTVPTIPDVTRAMTIDRTTTKLGMSWDHHACKVVMVDGTDYVFDWYPTLDPHNPHIYRTNDWRLDQNEVPFIKVCTSMIFS